MTSMGHLSRAKSTQMGQIGWLKNFFEITPCSKNKKKSNQAPFENLPTRKSTLPGNIGVGVYTLCALAGAQPNSFPNFVQHWCEWSKDWLSSSRLKIKFLAGDEVIGVLVFPKANFGNTWSKWCSVTWWELVHMVPINRSWYYHAVLPIQDGMSVMHDQVMCDRFADHTDGHVIT